ncbi:proton-translocating NADH-quinone oxidoreductase, chain L [Rubrobacter radiotolerans]|uniref:NADH-quinone oxidoreductase subunit L n=1 Tax=Rubrobacter radiotolerans TaxID=42256 RepID=A0A023X4B8_RUBRA|nr:NADH-quinone oxidoreductase subunit L [Rubrobacter radiotolerans]AHY46850.1 proton-translocating NADH-quinone oxidoreductase, chain L [Rubrobacter radiotolerans]MDX5894256.1 NADH-quinone oxidoreductase subunit L [Rubrobacter radiotolerans]SMC05576.1 NADH dehydrogenase subunit L [Rubrobacter radiotolerans DSM 5868]
MTSVGQQLIITAIPAIPFIVFFLLVIFGRVLKENAQYLSVFGIVFSLVFSIFALYTVVSTGQPIEFSVNWVDLGPGGSFSFGILVDAWAAVMLIIVCVVSLMVQLFSGGFMEGHPRFAWYYAVATIFSGSMLALVVSTNFIQAYFFWELVGATSYLIHGFYFEKNEATYAAQKAFIVNRVADAALLIGIIILWRGAGTTSFEGIAQAAQVGFIDQGTLTVALLFIFLGVTGKSAQLPLHVWLKNAMQGPTPLSALIHAAAMILSGVYLFSRTYDIFVQSATAMAVAAFIGGVTAFMAATMALVQKDIKYIIAYSTISQLGYVTLGLGVGAYSAALFHIYNHAFFKSLLFLMAGALGYALGTYSMEKMGGLRRRMPVTFWSIVIASLSLAGIFPLAGFWSKDAIIAETLAGGHYFLFALAISTVFMTAFYMFRGVFLCFFGEPRSEEARNAREVPGIMAVPMIILAVLSVASGWVGIPSGFGLPVPDLWDTYITPSTFAEGVLALEPHGFSYLLAGISVLIALAGIATAYLLVVSRPELAASLGRRFPRAHAFLLNGWYFDELYDRLFVRPAFAIGRGVKRFDDRVIRGGSEGLGRAARGLGGLIGRTQTGGVQNYVLFILGGVFLIGVVVGAFAVGAQYVALAAVILAAITLGTFVVGARL